MTIQNENLARVQSAIGVAVMHFYTQLCFINCRLFCANELRRHVEKCCGPTAPGSADRILRALRQDGRLDYEVISRSQSLYQFLPVGVVE